MAVFQSLGELGEHLQVTGMKIADPGIPLWDVTAGGGDFGPVWADQPSVRKVVSFIARNLSSIPLHVYDRVGDGDRRRVRDHPLARTVGRPSSAPAQTGYRFWESVLIDGLIFDRWCLMKVRHGGELELVRIPARRVRFKADALDRIEKVVIYQDGKAVEHDPAKFIIDVGYSERGASGTSPMQTLRHLLEESREAVEYRRSVWKNGARFPLVLERADKFSSDAAYNRFVASWSAFIRGGPQTGGTPILEDGMKARAIEGFKPQETGDLEGRRLTDIETASSYHIAPELVGAREGTYSNIDAFRQMLYRDNLGPYIDAWVQALNASLVPELAPGTDYYIEPHMESKLRGSFEEQAKVLSSAIGAPWMLRSEGRGRMNLPAIDGADELVTPLNVLIGGQASPRDSGSQNEGPKAARGPRMKARAPETHEDKHAQVLTAFFKRQAQAVKSLIGAGSDWWDAGRWDRELAEDLWRLAIQTSETVAKSVAADVGSDPDEYDVDRTLAFLATVAERQAKGINIVTERKVTEALDEDEPLDAVDHVFEVASDSRAKQIAVTAVTAASGFAAREVAQQLLGDKATKTWSAQGGPDSRHSRLDGETVPVGENFSIGAPWPGDASLDVDDTANCKCSMTINPAP